MLLKADIEEFCMGLERDGCPRAATTLQHFYTLFRERDELSTEVDRLRRALEWIANHGEVDDAEDIDEQAGGFGLDADEFVRMAHDNLIVFARNALSNSLANAASTK